MERVLVTGASGFIGKQLIAELIKKGKGVTAVLRDDGKLAGMRDSCLDIVHCPMEEIAKLEKTLGGKEQYDTLYHLAWGGTSGVGRSDYRMQSNHIRYTLDLIHAASELGIKRFVGAGTIAEYDNLCYLPLDNAIPNAVSMYGAAKIAAHFMSKIECNRLGMEHIWGIFSNIYGPGNETGNFVNFAVRMMLSRERAAFTAGEQYYDFVYISDFIKGLYLLGEYGKGNHEYFIGSGTPRKLKEYIYVIRDAVDKNIELYLGEIPFRGVSLRPEQLTIKKLQNVSGYVPAVGFEEGIERTVEWYRESMKSDNRQ